jgi:deoxyribonuclease-1
MRLALLVVLLAGCADGAFAPQPWDPFDDAKADHRLVLQHVKVVGELLAGETSPPVAYRDPPLYTALRLHVDYGGADLELEVRSEDGDGFVRLLDASFAVIATARAVGPVAVLRAPVSSGVHYVAFRDHARADATFTVTWRDGGLFPGLLGEALELALLAEMEGHTPVGYTTARRLMFDAETGIDVADGVTTCVYTGTIAVGDGSPTPPGMSIEHVWPQSRGADAEPMRSDLHHLLPALGTANSARNNHHYGETRCGLPGEPACEWAGGGAALGPDAAGRLVFMPRAARRGDGARATFYFAVRYGHDVPPDEEEVLREWCDRDPPDALERARNDAVQARQGNRNLFVDDPGLPQRILDF